MGSEKYDDLEVHYLNVTADVPRHQFGVPTGQYLAWLIRRGWASDELNARAADLASGSTTGAHILWEDCDGKLLADDLNDAGNDFTASYFEQRYFDDYARLFGVHGKRPEALYGPADTPQNAALVARMLDARVRAATVSPGLPNLDALRRRLLTIAREHLEPDGFEPTPQMHVAKCSCSIGVQKRYPGGAHVLTLGTYLDPARGHHGFYADLDSIHERLAAALYAAFTPDERAMMSSSSSRFVPLQLPMHAWARPHPMLAEVQEGVDRWDWIGQRRMVVAIPDADGIDTAAHTLMQLLDRDLLPMLPELQFPAGVAQLKCRSPLRSAPANHSSHDRGILIAAVFARLPNVVELCDEMADWVRDGRASLPRNDLDVLEFIERIRSEALAARP